MRREAYLKEKLLPTISFLMILLIVLPLPSFSENKENKLYVICPDKIQNLLEKSIKAIGWTYVEGYPAADGVILEIPYKIHNLKIISIRNVKGYFEHTVYFELLQLIKLHNRYLAVFERVRTRKILGDPGDLYVKIILLDENSSLPYVCGLQIDGLFGTLLR